MPLKKGKRKAPNKENKAVCRMCARKGNGVFNIHDIVDKIHLHFHFAPQPDDPFPDVICIKCMSQIDNFHKYYLKVQETQRDFFSLPNSQQSSNELRNVSEILDILHEIKTEPVEEIILKEDNDQEKGIEILYDIPHLDTAALEKGQLECINIDIMKLETIEEDENFEIQNDEILENDDKLKLSEDGGSSDEWSPKSDDETIESSQEDEDDSLETKKRKSPRKTKGKSNKKRAKTEEELSKSDQMDKEIAKFMKLKCHQCTSEYEKFADLSLHYRTIHNKKPGYIHCCNAMYNTRPEILDHFRWHQNPNAFHCAICSRSFMNQRTLRSHLKARHPSPDVKLYKCDKCPKAYVRQFELRNHSLVHEPSQCVTCDKCNKSFKTMSVLRRHILVVHDKAEWTVCDICAKVLKSKKRMELHRASHDDVPMVQCKVCEKYYKNDHYLKRHMLIHDPNDQEPCKCDICGTMFPSKRLLKRHQGTMHNWTIRYGCHLCEKEFRRKFDLKEHIARHTGEILYSCRYCSRMFQSNANMHTHLKKSHPKEFAEARKQRELARKPADAVLDE